MTSHVSSAINFLAIYFRFGDFRLLFLNQPLIGRCTSDFQIFQIAEVIDPAARFPFVALCPNLPCQKFKFGPFIFNLDSKLLRNISHPFHLICSIFFQISSTSTFIYFNIQSLHNSRQKSNPNLTLPKYVRCSLR